MLTGFIGKRFFVMTVTEYQRYGCDLREYALAAFIWCTFLVALLIAWNT